MNTFDAKIMDSTVKNICIHIFCWVLYLATIFLAAENWDHEFLNAVISNNLPVVILFYVNVLFILPRYLAEKKYLPLLMWLVFLNVLVIFLRFIFMLILQGGTLSDLLDAQLGPRILGLLRINLLFSGISFAYWYAKRTIAVERNQQRLEKEISDAQLMLLKNQVSPHFLYNTLSFLYTKALPLSADLSDAIAKLSDMMRYALTDMDKDETVPLEKEIAHMENFIGIHQLRFKNELYTKITIVGDPGQYRVMPFLLITFIENAFKHGKVNDPENPLIIKITMAKGTFHFFTSNKKSTGIKERSSGIGLANIKNRLALAYPGLYKLDIIDSSEHYSVDLTINVSQ